ncbi:MAG TPA: bifunctional precorrin-2 dehydrogenase/sirohydrochlorin ferrochelatase [Terriglobales bacterium]|jgi:precorrin-2 dehydrogenase/sirohydrochlorin ferrochelatase
MDLFPIFVKLAGRRCLVVGAGTVAAAKIRSLLDAGAEVRVVALAANQEVADWAEQGRVKLKVRAFQPSDLDRNLLVVAATNSRPVNAAIYREAELRGVLCNAVDDPQNCDFYYPAVVRRGDLQIAISTAGKSPSLAQRLRKELESEFGPEYSEWLTELGEARARLFARPMAAEERKRRLHRLASRKAFAASRRGKKSRERVHAR